MHHTVLDVGTSVVSKLSDRYETKTKSPWSYHCTVTGRAPLSLNNQFLVKSRLVTSWTLTTWSSRQVPGLIWNQLGSIPLRVSVLPGACGACGSFCRSHDWNLPYLVVPDFRWILVPLPQLNSEKWGRYAFSKSGLPGLHRNTLMHKCYGDCYMGVSKNMNLDSFPSPSRKSCEHKMWRYGCVCGLWWIELIDDLQCFVSISCDISI